VLSERTKFSGTLDGLITQFDSGDVVRGVSDYLASGEWKWSGGEAYKRYRENWPISPPIRKMLSESFRS